MESDGGENPTPRALLTGVTSASLGRLAGVAVEQADAAFSEAVSGLVAGAYTISVTDGVLSGDPY